MVFKAKIPPSLQNIFKELRADLVARFRRMVFWKGETGRFADEHFLEPDEEVLGVRRFGIGTYADVLGNTKVQMDGGAWIWNRKAEDDGNILT